MKQQQERNKLWTEKEKKNAKELLKEAQKILGIDHFDIRVIFEENRKEDPILGTETLAETTPNDSYLEAVIVLYRGFLEQSLKDQLKCVIHELIHAILAPIDRYARKAVSPQMEEFYARDMENVVVLLTRAVINGRSEGQT